MTLQMATSSRAAQMSLLSATSSSPFWGPLTGRLLIQASAAAINNQPEWKTECMEQRGRMRAAGRVGVFRVTGWTAAHPLCSKSGKICWPLWLPACWPSRELREGISALQRQ
ncbi:unnamed protein product [Tetraodon nigroviridis]|uniref:(spotted green pufferfish) hypothetical protein n=1 Tax=Tetraodon nigroviridis TaxID=99883 RepID=Q4S7W4_TETNG|nr:unnamed protein product [Tetraodon nigroviridis]